METPDSRVKLVPTASAQLRQYLHLACLPRPGVGPASHHWEVRDVVGHLILGADLYLGAISRGLQGDTSPPAGGLPAGRDRQCSVLVGPLRPDERGAPGKPRDQLLATFTATSDQLHQLFRVWP